MFKRTRYTEEEFINAVKNNQSVAGVLKDIGIKATGANYKSFKQRVKSLNLCTNHFAGQGHLKGKNHNWTPPRNFDDILVIDSDYLTTSHLKSRLIKADMLENKCYECNLQPEWNGKALVMHLDHINGVNNDNRIENLRLLCPNCHSQTKTYAGKNKAKSKSKDKPKKPKNIRMPRTDNLCIDCNVKISRKSTRCRSCSGKMQENKIVWPETSELIQMVETSNYSVVARQLGISDNAIRKRIKNHKK